MTPEHALAIVKESVSLVCKIPLSALSAQTRPTDVKGWDSFGRLQVALEMEARLGHPLQLHLAVALNSIGEMAAFIASVVP